MSDNNASHAGPVLDRAARIRSLAAVIACITVTGMGLGTSIPLLALSMERQGVSGVLIGLNTATAALATFALTPFIPAILRRIPTITFLYLCILLSSLVMLGYYLLPNIWLWFGIRFLHGAAIAGLFVVSEFWINHLAEEHRRGFLIGVYATVLSAGFAAGPLLLYFVGTQGFAPFGSVALLMLVAGLPLVLARGLAPRITERPAQRFAAFLVAAPAATMAALVYGAVETDVFNMLPIYFVRIGASEQVAAFALTIFAAGNIFLQIPIGLIADRVNKRLVLAACAAIGFAGSLAIPALSGSLYLLVPMLFVFGGVVAGLYTVGLTLLGQRFRGADLAAANGAFVVMYSAGGLIGPPMAGFAMDLWDPHGLAIAMGSLSGVYLGVALWRLWRGNALKTRGGP